MKESRFERIKREKRELEKKNNSDEEPANPYKWIVNETPKNELTNNRKFRISYNRILDDCPF